MPLDQAKRRKRRVYAYVAVLLIVVLTPLAWFGYGFVYTLMGLQDAYAQWDTGTLLIEFMETNDDKWPTGWEDLQPSYDRLAQHTAQGRFFRGSHTFNELRTRIGIDWHADPATLVTLPDNRRKRPFQVIWSLSGNTTAWSNGEPNQMILDYLREKQQAKNGG